MAEKYDLRSTSDVRKECYTIGVDFGTLSARAVLVRVSDGFVLAEKSMAYPHGIFEGGLPDGTPLKRDVTLGDPMDYPAVLAETVRGVMEESGAAPEDVIGIGIDATSCTVIPVDAEGVPLSENDAFRSRPHAWMKLWKHHGAQKEADEVFSVLKEKDPDRLSVYGGHISSEWFFPKLLETAREDPEVFDAADRFLDAPDFITMYLTGKCRVNACGAGFKALWSPDTGYPGKDVLTALSPAFADIAETKLRAPVIANGARAGYLRKEAAERLGLTTRTAVSAGNVDAHVAFPGVGITEPGTLLMIIGTSSCAMLVSPEYKAVGGICGCVPDGLLPNLYAYEAGQPCVGDLLGWYTEHCLPAEYKKEADALGIDGHQLLTRKEASLAPGQNHLIALDWWNGNRSILDNSDLSGMLLGLTLDTRPEDIYRALMEATAFGMRVIIDHFEGQGVKVAHVAACGGIAGKNELMMQIYSDVFGREIKISEETQAGAVGSAMFGAVAAGKEAGGYADIYSAAENMAGKAFRTVSPDADAHAVYDRMYRIYRHFHDDLGIRNREIMSELRHLI